MSYKIKKIVSFKTTETNKSFCLDLISVDNAGLLTDIISRKMYFADIEDENKFIFANGIYYNKGCLKDISADSCFATLYNIKDLYLKSAIYGNNTQYNFPNTYAFQNVFNYKLSNDLTNQIQVDNYIYLMNTTLYNIGKYCFTRDIYSELSLNNGYAQMPYELLSTCTLKINQLSTLEVIPLQTYTNVKYNLFFEIPGNIKNDYDSGNYAANTYITKNHYNSQYDMTHNGISILTNARRYIAIDHCNNQVYLKYYDDMCYTNNTAVSGTQLYDLKFQRIETVKALNRYEAINTHKTNYYDIDVVCEKMFNDFNNAIENQQSQKLKDAINLVKLNLKYEIANCIVDICKNIAPVDTQLVKVNVLDNELG